jgi:uncharacterized protein
MKITLPINQTLLATFCDKWKVTEFSLFGSVLRDDFRSDSDVDVLVSFAEDASWSLFDLVDMEDELKVIFGREVDLVLRKSVERSKNPYRQQAILSTAQVIYASR